MKIARTKKEFERIFRHEYMPAIRREESSYMGGGVDIPLRREEWNNTIDALVQDQLLPVKALDWVCPW